MKNGSFLPPLFASLALLNFTVTPIPAADTPAPGSTVTSSPPLTAQGHATPPAAVQKLPYGADDVLKLSQGKVSEDIILTYVQTSGMIYDLKPNDIVYLK